MTAPNTHGWIGLKEAAVYLGLDQRTVAKGVHEGKIPGFAIGSRYLFLKKWLDLWLDGVWITHLSNGIPTKVEVELPAYLHAI